MPSVSVFKKAGRKYLQMRYRDAETGVEVRKSAGTNDRKKAERLAGKWEKEIEKEGRATGRALPWQRFREQWESTQEASLSDNTAATYAATWSKFSDIAKPRTVSDIKPEKVAAFVSGLREEGRSDATVARHLRHLKAIARWAYREELLAKVPYFNMPSAKTTSVARGKAISDADFDDMLDAVPEVVRRADAVEDWRFFLRGLWWSGLRLGEALELRWDHQLGGVSVELSGREDSVLVFDAEAQKSGQVERVPLAFEAADMLEPLKRKSGPVFRLGGYSRILAEVSRRVAAIGEAAGVVTLDAEKVSKRYRGGKGATTRTATAHDLRRSFGERWAARSVEPADLQIMMRHASITTTMTYYAGDTAKERAKSINRRALGLTA